MNTWLHLSQDPSFWVAVSFVLFVTVFGRTLWRRLAAFLDARSDAVRSEMEQARKLRDEAQELLENFVRKRREADAESRAIVERAEAEAIRIREEGERTLEQRLERMRLRTRQDIDRAEQVAFRETRARLTDLVMEASRDLINRRLDPALQERLAGQAVDDFRGRLEAR